MVVEEVLHSEGCRSLLGLWQRLRGARRFPAWTDVDLAELRPWMGWLFILDFPEPVSERARYTLIGSHVEGWLGAELTGRWTDEPLLGRGTTELGALFGRSRRLARPAAAVIAARDERGCVLSYEQLLLPFAYRCAEPPDRLLGLVQVLRPAQGELLPLSTLVSVAVRHESLIEHPTEPVPLPRTG